MDLHSAWAFLVNSIKNILNFVVYLKNRKLNAIRQIIAYDIDFYQKFQNQLTRYVDNQDNHEIGLRLIFWKNYPNNLNDDGYKYNLNITYFWERKTKDSYIDHNGILIREDIWFLQDSVYIDKYGIFFIAEENQNHAGFIEHSDVYLVRHIPFSNIIAYDFDRIIEHEPVIYTQYSYNDPQLFSSDIDFYKTDENDRKNGHQLGTLQNSNHMKKYNPLVYALKKIKHIKLSSVDKDDNNLSL